MARTKPSLVTLGLDVLVTITSFLRPPDIVSLRLTCKTLQGISMSRIIWINALRQMMDEHDIPKHTFPIESMKSNVLEQLATSPARFGHLIRTETEDPTNPTYLRILPDFALSKEDRLLGVESWAEYIDCMLVPGGRYFFVFQEVRTPVSLTYLHLWDLGVRGHDDRNRIILRTLLGDQHIIRPVKLCPVPDGSGVYLICIEKGDIEMLIVYKATAFSEAPTITAVNKLPIQGRVLKLTVSGTQIAYMNTVNILVVWDFKDDKSISWNSHLFIEDVPGSEKTIHIYNNTLMLYRSGELILWKIPPLRPLGASNSISLERSFTLTSLFDMQENDAGHNGEDGHSTYMVIQNPWESTRHVENIAFYNPASELFSIKWIKRFPSHDDCMPGAIPINGVCVEDPTGHEDTHASPLMPCNNFLVTYFLADDESSVNMLMFPRVGPKINPPLPVCEFKSFDINFFRLGIQKIRACVATGRICVLADESIFVLDFV